MGKIVKRSSASSKRGSFTGAAAGASVFASGASGAGARGGSSAAAAAFDLPGLFALKEGLLSDALRLPLVLRRRVFLAVAGNAPTSPVASVAAPAVAGTGVVGAGAADTSETTGSEKVTL